MSTNHTPNYQLSQWEPGDQVLRADFNADNAKIDAAIKAVDTKYAAALEKKASLSALAVKTEVFAGTYTGDGTAERFISLGFMPKAVYVCSVSGITYINGNSGTSYRGGLAVPGSPAVYMGYSIVEIVSGGFKVFYKEVKPNNVSTNHYGANITNMEFHYIAFK